MPQDLGVEGVSAGLPFVSSVLWKRDKDSEPFWRLMMRGCHELDDCRRVNKKTSRLLTDDVDIGWGWPILCDITVASVPDYLG